jgi:hypothetical protein
MTSLVILQLIVSLSVLWVWLMRREAVISEFERFGLSKQTLTTVGAAKILLSLMMMISIWFPVISIPSTLGMTYMMIAAQYYHMRFDSPLDKRLPSLVLLLMCILILV